MFSNNEFSSKHAQHLIQIQLEPNEPVLESKPKCLLVVPTKCKRHNERLEEEKTLHFLHI